MGSDVADALLATKSRNTKWCQSFFAMFLLGESIVVRTSIREAVRVFNDALLGGVRGQFIKSEHLSEQLASLAQEPDEFGLAIIADVSARRHDTRLAGSQLQSFDDAVFCRNECRLVVDVDLKA